MENDNVVSNMLNNLIIQNVVSAPLENIINKYTKKWFSADGTFAGFDTVAVDIDHLTGEMNDLLQQIKASLKKVKQMEAEISSLDRDFKALVYDNHLQYSIEEFDDICSQVGIIKRTAKPY